RSCVYLLGTRSRGLPLQNEFVVGLVDVAAQRDQVEMQFAQIETAADPLFDRFALDDEAPGRVDLHHGRIGHDGGTRIVGLDGIDDRTRFVVRLKRYEYGMGHVIPLDRMIGYRPRPARPARPVWRRAA